MTPELKAKWIAALRSGEYRQGHGALYSPDINAYCCLGVLCVVANDHVSYKSVERAGVSDDHQRDCWALNDGVSNGRIRAAKRRHTFPEIADYIETNL